MKKSKNTKSVTVLVVAIFTIIVGFSQCGCGMVRHAESKSTLQISGNQIDLIATKSSKGMVEEDSIEYELKEAGPKVIKRKITLKGHHDDEAEYSQRAMLRQSDFKQKNTAYIIKHDFDLMGGTIVMPVDCELVFEGGSLNNGIIIGNNTSIIYSGAIFNGIGIKGNWNVPEIRSGMFGDVTLKVNRLKDVIALTNSKVENTVYIEEGDYFLDVSYVTEHLLPLTSNTTVNLEGTIRVKGNSFPRYRIFSIVDVNNVVVKGNGKIVGDRDWHNYTPEVPDPESKRGLNTTHEYGHGIQIYNSTNVEVSGISITKCIGDGICIIGTDVACKNLDVSYCRRQGISIVGGERISISDCCIAHIWGSRKAGFGIDIEPAGENTASDITITNCDISTCNGGINVQCHTFECVNSVNIINCLLSTFAQDNIKEDGHEQYRAMMCFGARDCEVKGCTIEDASTCLVYVEDAVAFAMRECNLISRGSRYGIILRESRGTVTLHKNIISMFDRDSKNPHGIAIANLNNAILTDNEIISDEFSASGDTDIRNVVLRGNIINARWETGREVSGSTIEKNTFKKRVVLDKVNESTLKDNQMYSLKVKSKDRSEIISNKTER